MPLTPHPSKTGRRLPGRGNGILRARRRTAFESAGPPSLLKPKTMAAASDPDFAVVDLFAGAGGLGEGFASYTDPDGSRPFRLRLSVEKDPFAWETLYFRHFLRQFPAGFPDEYYAFLNGETPEPDWARRFPRETATAREEALRLELGRPATTKAIAARVARIHQTHGPNTILVGGPPCQGYSLVGRARNAGRADYDPNDDPRLTLYRHYCKVMELLEPAAFVMENVKGILSSSRKGRNIFPTVCRTLEKTGPEYALFPLTADTSASEDDEPSRYIVRAENYGVPQARHRVIVVGLRTDLVREPDRVLAALARPDLRTTPASAVLGGMPVLRSRLSRGRDSQTAWLEAIRQAAKALRPPPPSVARGHRTRFDDVVREMPRKIERRGAPPPRSRIGVGPGCPTALRDWILDPRLRTLPNNDVRSHMPSDVQRYFFAAVWAEVHGESPKAAEFPKKLAPAHRNWSSGAFVDRFRVQLRGEPARTVTSHISRDGHYYIHPDPSQARSLTVREAARLQTFPDNYLFRGPRTAQYIQVGNAVPPLLARQIAAGLWKAIRGVALTSRRRSARPQRAAAA